MDKQEAYIVHSTLEAQTSVYNTMVGGKVVTRKPLGSIISVVSCKSTQCKNESDDEDHQAKYLSCEFKQ